MADISKIQLPDGNKYDVKDTTKQPLLVSGTNIKTINNESLLGSGNITIQGGSDQVFIVTYGSGRGTCDDVADAYNAGKAIFAKKYVDADFIQILPLVEAFPELELFIFEGALGSTTNVVWTLLSDGWTEDAYDLVPTYRTINGKALSSNITLTASDVGATKVQIVRW